MSTVKNSSVVVRLYPMLVSKNSRLIRVSTIIMKTKMIVSRKIITWIGVSSMSRPKVNMSFHRLQHHLLISVMKMHSILTISIIQKKKTTIINSSNQTNIITIINNHKLLNHTKIIYKLVNYNRIIYKLVNYNRIICRVVNYNRIICRVVRYNNATITISNN